MDRTAFLRSLPCLITANHPPWNVFSEESCRVEVSLQDSFFLSIEPLLEKPAFFLPAVLEDEKSDPEQDPAQTIVEMAFIYHQNESNDRASTKITPGGAWNSPVDIKAPVNSSSCSPRAALLRTEDNSYILDSLQLMRVESVLEPLHHQRGSDETKHGQTAISKPPYLLLVFESVVFRIFASLSADLSTVKEKFLNVERKLTDMLQAERNTLPYEFSRSPSDDRGVDSHTSSSEPGQEPCRKRTSEDQGDYFRSQTHLTRKRRSHSDCLRSLRAIREILRMPSSHFEARVGTSPSIAVGALNPLLNAAADLLGASYCSHADVQEASQACSEALNKTKQKLEEALQAFFPPPRSKYQHKQSPISETAPDIASVAELVKCQKEVIRMRQETILLQYRGE